MAEPKKKEVESSEKKDPIIAAVLSFLIPGVGQMYLGTMKKGAVLLGAYIAVWVIITIIYVVITLVTFGFGAICFPVFFAPVLVNIFAAYDAYKSAQGEPVWKFQ